MDGMRRCEKCRQPAMKLYESKPIRLGIVEEGYLCDCGWSIKTMNAFGLVIWWVLAGALAIAFGVALLAGKVKPGDEVPVALFALVLVGFLAGMGAKATIAHLRNPIVR